MARIFLLNPPGPMERPFTREGRCTQEAGVWGTVWPPITLATCGALLEEQGHRVRILDAAVCARPWRRLAEELAAFRPEMVVWTTGTPTLQHDLSLGRWLKRTLPGTFACVTGTHVTARPQDALGYPDVDAVVQGEPERPLAVLAWAFAGDLSSVPGLAFRDPESGRVRRNPPSPFLPGDSIPAPAWHLLDARAYRLPLKGRPFLLVAPVRGCPFSCSFCTAPLHGGRRLRKRPLKQVLDEIAGNVLHHGVRDLLIWADTFTADRSYVQAFCDGLLHRQLPVAWTCNSRVDTVDRETLHRMKRAGCWMISFGLESGSQDVLDRCGKEIALEQSERAVRLAHEAGLRTSGHFMLGLPGESRQSMFATLALALRLPLDAAQFYAASPFPGTRLHDEAVRNRWLSRPQGFSQGQAAMDLPGLSAEEVNRFRRLAYRRFYRRPRALFKLIRMIEPGVLSHPGINLRGVLRWMMGTR